MQSAFDKFAKRSFAIGDVPSRRDPVLDVGGPLDGWHLTMMDIIRFSGVLKTILRNAEKEGVA